MRKFLPTLALAALCTVAGANTAHAEDQWQKDHPRRAEVIHRLDNQNARIHDEVQDGQISKQQAANLHHQDHQIRQEERDMASQDGGHITRQEDATLNQQENHVSREIGH
jgi:hypothetical protein